jgi:hypothetical protein
MKSTTDDPQKPTPPIPETVDGSGLGGLSGSTISDTPRTDKHVTDNPISGWIFVRADFARELERENARLLEITDRLKKCASAFLGWHTSDVSVGVCREITEAILDAKLILSNAELRHGANNSKL